MRSIDQLIVNCSAPRNVHHDTVPKNRQWHLQRKFADIGYHYVVYLDGTVHKGRHLEKAGAHCKGHNAHSIGICYVGGLDCNGKPKDTRTAAQKAALLTLIRELRQRFPRATVHGHREFAAKACPCFDAKKEYSKV